MAETINCLGRGSGGGIPTPLATGPTFPATGVPDPEGTRVPVGPKGASDP